MNVAFTYNTQRSKSTTHLDQQTDLEFDTPEVIEGIVQSLTRLGHRVYPIEADWKALTKLAKLKNKIHIVLNIAEGMGGEARESQIPIYCEMLNIPYTHSGPTTHALGLNKSWTKQFLLGVTGINVPASVLISTQQAIIPPSLKYPLIIKPNSEGSSKGILDKNVVHGIKTLKERLKIMSDNFRGGVIVEEYIEGREFTVGVIGNNETIEVLPIIEQKFDFLPKGMNKIASYELKWIYEDKLHNLQDAYDCPAQLTKKERKLIEDTTRLIYRTLNVCDCARIDYRLDSKDKLYFIEINTLPGMVPDEKIMSYFPLAARTAGYSFDQMIEKILQVACKRWGLKYT
ncbi:MAG: ATP-grasp domain-containing protein [bacterium]